MRSLKFFGKVVGADRSLDSCQCGLLSVNPGGERLLAEGAVNNKINALTTGKM